MQTPVGTVATPEKETQPSRTKPNFPFLDLQAQFAEICDEVMDAIRRVMDSQRFILGEEVRAFEGEVAALVGAPAAVGCASGSDALLLALMALGIHAGDEVITTPFTFVATVGAIERLGAKPVFVDINPDTFNIDPGQIETAISPRTRVIMPVHLFGLAADLDPILKTARSHGLAVVEDAAQAIGASYNEAPVGNLGTFGCFSFFPSKNLGAAGDGGLITTNDPELADRLRVIRVHGARDKYHYEVLGINSRLDALQAAILRVKLRHLEKWTAARRRNADRYRKLAAEFGLQQYLALPISPAGCFHVYNQFTVRAPERDRLRAFLAERGIPTEIYYPAPLHLQAAFTHLGYRPGAFPFAEAASREVLSLPIYPELREEHQARAVEAIADFYASTR